MEEVHAGKKIAEVLAEFVVTHNSEDLPPAVIEKAKHHIIDTVGCIVGASNETQAKILLEIMGSEGGNPHSSVFGQGLKTSAMNAALLHGTLGHTFDFDDDHREGTMHPSIAVLPALLALGEKANISGKQLLRSYCIGMEVMIRIGEAYLGKSYYQGFHPTGTCGVFGAAAGCAALLGLNATQTIYALGLAGSFAAGTLEWRTEGSWQKPLQAGHPAMFGVLAASLAQKDFIGARTIFDGPDGVIRAFSFKDTYDYNRITENLGNTWEMVDTSIKVHACCRFGAPVADCALDLYEQGVRAQEVKTLIAKVSDFTIRVLCTPPEKKFRPETHVDGKFSLPFTAAVAICKNRTGVPEFSEMLLNDPEILELASKVTWELDPAAEALYPKAYPATLVATLHNGQAFEAHVDYPRGDPENPASIEDIVDKFNGLTRDFYDEPRRKDIVDAVLRLDEIDAISALTDLLR
jgi:2-methylcitrate dehydratase PrpD